MINRCVLLVLTVMLMCSCVDETYDLSDIKTDGVEIGSGGVVVPVGDVDRDLSDFLIPEDPSSPPEGQNVTLSDYDEVFDIGTGFDEGIIDQLTDNGTIMFVVMIDNPLDVDLKLNISFLKKNDPDSVVPVVINEIIKSGKEGVSKIETLEITPEMLEQIALSDELRVQLSMASGEPVYFEFSEFISNIKIRLSMKKTGGIKL